MRRKNIEAESAVIDTSCLIHLWKLELISKLVVRFNRIYIPRYVEAETGRKGKLKNPLKELIKNNNPFLQICDIGNSYDVQLLYDRQLNPDANIDRGESEVIIQARERGISNVLIDDRKGRKMAVAHTLSVKGTLGILIELKRIGLIESVTPLLWRIGNTKIKVLKRLQVSPELFSDFLKECDEVEYFNNFLS